MLRGRGGEEERRLIVLPFISLRLCDRKKRHCPIVTDIMEFSFVQVALNVAFNATVLIIQAIRKKCQDHGKRIEILKEMGWKMEVCNRIVESIQRQPGLVDQAITFNLEKGMEDLRDEVTRVTNMPKSDYQGKSKECEKKLDDLVDRVEWQLKELQFQIDADQTRLLQQIVAAIPTIQQQQPQPNPTRSDAEDPSKPAEAQVPLPACLLGSVRPRETPLKPYLSAVPPASLPQPNPPRSDAEDPSKPAEDQVPLPACLLGSARPQETPLKPYLSAVPPTSLSQPNPPRSDAEDPSKPAEDQVPLPACLLGSVRPQETPLKPYLSAVPPARLLGSVPLRTPLKKPYCGAVAACPDHQTQMHFPASPEAFLG